MSAEATTTPNDSEPSRVVFSESKRCYVFAKDDNSGFGAIKMAVGEGQESGSRMVYGYKNLFLTISDFGMLPESELSEFFEWITSSKYFGMCAVTGSLPVSEYENDTPVWLTARTMSNARALIAHNLPVWLSALVALILDFTDDIDSEEFFAALSVSVPKVTLNRVTGENTVESFARLVRTVGLDSAASASRQVPALSTLTKWVQLVEGRSVKVSTDFDTIKPEALVRLCFFIDAVGVDGVRSSHRDQSLWFVLPTLMSRLDDRTWRQAGRIQAALLGGMAKDHSGTGPRSWAEAIGALLGSRADEVESLFARMFAIQQDRVKISDCQEFSYLFTNYAIDSAPSGRILLCYMLFATMLSAYGIEVIDAAHRSISEGRDSEDFKACDFTHLIAVIEMGSFGEPIDRDDVDPAVIESILGVMPNLAYSLMLGE